MAEAAHGGEVVGLSNAEWLQCRRGVARGQFPVRGGASLTSRTALLCDGVGASVIAPATQWPGLPWQAEVCDHLLATRARLLRLRTGDTPCEAKDWPSSRDPLSRAVLAARRAGWSALSGARWLDHRGPAIGVSRTPL
eukprot:1317064-Pyramimonas_sp.AAC.1